MGGILHLSRALAAASTLATRGLVRGGFFTACHSRAGVRAHTGPTPIVVASFVGALLSFTATATWADEPLKPAGSELEPVRWTEFADWTADDHLAAFAAYQTSCRASRKIRRTDHHGEIFGALRNVCRNAIGLRPQDADTARTFFEQNFQPVRIAVSAAEPRGLRGLLKERFASGNALMTAKRGYFGKYAGSHVAGNQ